MNATYLSKLIDFRETANAAHREFLGKFPLQFVSPQVVGSVGHFFLNEHGIQGEIYDHPVRVERRFVLVKNPQGDVTDATNEYNFYAIGPYGEEMKVFEAYLDVNGALTKDILGNSRLGDRNSQYLANNLIEAVLSAMISQGVFSMEVPGRVSRAG